MKAVKSFPAGSAPGPSGLRPSHLVEALTCGAGDVEQKLLNVLTKFCNFFVSGEIPSESASVLLAASLFPFRKGEDEPVSGGVRPIAVGDTLWRVIAKCVVGGVGSTFRRLVSPVQCGVAMPDAVHSIGTALGHCRDLLKGDSALGILQVVKQCVQ